MLRLEVEGGKTGSVGSGLSLRGVLEEEIANSSAEFGAS